MTSPQPNRPTAAREASAHPLPRQLRMLLWQARVATWTAFFLLLLAILTRHLVWFYALPIGICTGYLGAAASLGARRLIVEYRQYWRDANDD